MKLTLDAIKPQTTYQTKRDYLAEYKEIEENQNLEQHVKTVQLSAIEHDIFTQGTKEDIINFVLYEKQKLSEIKKGL